MAFWVLPLLWPAFKVPEGPPWLSLKMEIYTELCGGNPSYPIMFREIHTYIVVENRTDVLLEMAQQHNPSGCGAPLSAAHENCWRCP